LRVLNFGQGQLGGYGNFTVIKQLRVPGRFLTFALSEH